MQPLSNLAIQINIPFRVVLQAQMASQRRDVFHTSFLTPPIIKEAMLAIEKLADIKAVAQGGYPQVEFNTRDWLIAYIIYPWFLRRRLGALRREGALAPRRRLA
jgi:hypothetical protein